MFTRLRYAQLIYKHGNRKPHRSLYTAINCHLTEGPKKFSKGKLISSVFSLKFIQTIQNDGKLN